MPFKVQQDRYGNLLVSPASNRHNPIQVRTIKALERAIRGGEAFVRCSVQTSAQVKVPDFVWQPEAHHAEHRDKTPMSVALEICVEVLSPSNSVAEIRRRGASRLAAAWCSATRHRRRKKNPC